MYQNSWKKVAIPNEKPVTDVQFLNSTFRGLFDVQIDVNVALSFQRFDKEFQVYVDLEEDEHVIDREMLNVVMTTLPVAPRMVYVDTYISKSIYL